MTKEFANNNRPETTPEELKAKLERPEVISMLTRHFKQMVNMGILDAYRRSLLQEIAPMTDDDKDILLKIMSPEDIAKVETRKQDEKPFILRAIGMKAALLVGRDNSVDISEYLGDEYTEFSATRYFLQKYDIACGEPEVYSSADVAMITESPQPLVYPPFTEEQFSIIESHYREQIDNGIVISK